MSTTKQKTNICGGKLHPPVDCNNDILMVSEGIRPPLLRINRSVFEKTASEKRELKLKKTKVSPKGLSFKQEHESPIKMNLIIYCKYSKIDNFKSTHSFQCLKSEVRNHINNLINMGYKISKVYFNNKPYKYEY